MSSQSNLHILKTRFISRGGFLYDGDEPLPEQGALLPATDDQVRRDINALLVRHRQRELPVVKAKPKKEPKEPKEKKPRVSKKKPPVSTLPEG